MTKDIFPTGDTLRDRHGPSAVSVSHPVGPNAGLDASIPVLRIQPFRRPGHCERGVIARLVDLEPNVSGVRCKRRALARTARHVCHNWAGVIGLPLSPEERDL